MKFKVEKSILFPVLFGLVMAYLLFPSYLHNYLYPIDSIENYLWKTLDPSWVLTLNYVNLKELVWGKDFVFTFGPLGYLSTKFLWGVNKYSVLFFDLFIALNFLFIFSKLLIYNNIKIFSFLIVLIITLILPLFFGSSIALILFAFLIFWVLESISKFQYYNYIFQVIIVTLLFFIKINTGIIALLFFVIGLTFNLLDKKKYFWHYLTFAIFPFVAIYILANLFKVDLYNYIINSLELIRGYNDIQYLDIEENRNYFYLVLPLLLVLLTLFFLELKSKTSIKERIKTIIIFFNLGALWFITYKQAFVRADISHILEYFVTSNLILIIILYFFCNTYKKLTIASIVIILSLNVFMILYKSNQLNVINEKFSKASYINSFINYTELESLKLFPNDNQIPIEIKRIVGLSSVDVYPWNSYMLLENKLNFTPRPVFQSYTTYTKALQELNYNFYNGETAPEYIIYDLGATDDRYSFYDDARLNLIVFNKYQIKDIFDFKNRSLILLEKKNDTKELKLDKIKEYAMMIGDPIIPQENIFYEIELYINIKGKLKSFFFHAPDIELDFLTREGSYLTHRTSNELLKAGFFSNYYVADTNDFKMLMQEGSNQKKLLRIIVRPKTKGFFKDKFKVTEYKINQ